MRIGQRDVDRLKAQGAENSARWKDMRLAKAWLHRDDDKIPQGVKPSLQMALGVWLYGEAFDPARAIGFYLIWLALVIYSLDGLWNGRRQLAKQ